MNLPDWTVFAANTNHQVWLHLPGAALPPEDAPIHAAPPLSPPTHHASSSPVGFGALLLVKSSVSHSRPGDAAVSWKETEIRWSQVRDRDRTGDRLETTTALDKMDEDAKNPSSELQDGR